MPQSRLSTREQEVLKLIAEGKASKEVAKDLYISKRTVDFHITNIYEKYPSASNRIELLRAVYELGVEME